jgi:hypothetical protein
MRTILCLVLFAMTLSCQNKINNPEKKIEMIERFDFEVYKKITANEDKPYLLPNGNKIYMIGWLNKKNEGIQYERLPKPSFYTIYKVFHGNGNIKSKEMCIGNYVKVGISKYYDEQGNLIKEVDEDKKFGKIKPQDVLNFIDKKGYINLETREGNKEQDKNNRPTFELRYGNESGKYIYAIALIDALPNDNIDFSGGEPRAFMNKYYVMDGETGIVQDDYEISPEEAEKQKINLSPEEKKIN